VYYIYIDVVFEFLKMILKLN